MFLSYPLFLTGFVIFAPQKEKSFALIFWDFYLKKLLDNLENLYTKGNLYDRISYMDRIFRKKLNLVIGLLFAFITSLCLFFAINTNKTANAQNQNAISLLPSSDIEYYEFNDNVPKKTFFWDNNMAVILENTQTHAYNILFYLEGKGYTLYDMLDGKTPNQIKKLSDNLIAVVLNNVLYSIDVNDLTKSPQILESNSGPVSGSYFDLNKNHLVTVTGNDVYLYNLDNLTITDGQKLTDVSAEELTPICINETDELFYTDESSTSLKRINLTTKESSDLLSLTSEKLKFVANANYLFYTNGVNFYRIDLNTLEEKRLITPTTDFELGGISGANDICFKGNNLVVTDSNIPAIQEFCVNGENLEFTGFAVASGKTAYNRIGKSAKEIDLSVNSLAVLDDVKLTVIKDKDGDRFDKNNFVNLFLTDSILQGLSPYMMALGSENLILADTSKVAIIDYNACPIANLFTYTFEGGNNIINLTYQSGIYYVTKIKDGTGNSLAVYKIYKDAESYNVEELFFTNEDESLFNANSKTAVDVDGNVFITSEPDNAVYKFTKTQDGYNVEKLENVSESGVKKISTDLGGTLFMLREDSIDYYYSQTLYTLPQDFSGKLAKSFAMNYQEKAVYFIYTSGESIGKTESLPNVSAKNIVVPNEFKITDSTANLNKLEIYSPKDTANLYKVEKIGNSLIYQGLFIDRITNFIKICDLTITEFDTVNNIEINSKLSVLTGKDSNNGSVYLLCKDKDLEQITATSDCEKTLYVTTGVNLYYLPIITEDGRFCLTNDDGTVIRLGKKSPITVIKKVDSLQATFYLIKATINEKEVYGYIPLSFTVETLAENLTPQESTSLIEGNNPHALRNSLIVITLACSVLGTSFYFIFRKKD